MAPSKTASAKQNNRVNPTIQWVALAVVAGLAILAAFVFFGEDSTGGGHSGLGPAGGTGGPPTVALSAAG